MTRAARWWRGVLERWAARFYEGPEPPSRLAEIAQAFALEHPEATQEQWLAFAQAHGAECYRSGYVRGLEWTERDQDRQPWRSDLPPELVADQLDPDWRWRPAGGMGDPALGVPARLDGREELEMQELTREDYNRLTGREPHE